MPVTLAQVSKELIDTWAEVAQHVLQHCQRTGVYRLKGETMAKPKSTQQEDHRGCHVGSAHQRPQHRQGYGQDRG